MARQTDASRTGYAEAKNGNIAISTGGTVMQAAQATLRQRGKDDRFTICGKDASRTGYAEAKSGYFRDREKLI